MKTIILVDDDPDEFLIFSEVLDMLALPLQCTYINNFSQALIWLQNNTADFIFIDMLMPKITGIEVIKKMQDLSNTMNSKYILLSTYINDDLLKKAVAAGATACIQKADTVKTMALKIKIFFDNYQL